MNVPNNVRTAQNQHFAAILFAPVIVQGRIARLDVGSHGAVIDDDALAHVVASLGMLLVDHHELVSVEINPLRLVADGVLALDAVIEGAAS